MAFKWLPKLVVFTLCSSIANALNPEDQTGVSIDYGTFKDPSSLIRPRFRYWIPDASVDLNVVAEDFARAKEVGMGGLEVLGYYLAVDWTIYGWGTEAWKKLQDVALRASKELGLILDFALGPNQGADVPAHPDDEGVMWQLPFNTSVPVGGFFNDVLPGWGSGTFISASIGLVTSKENATWSAMPAWQYHEYNGTRQTLSTASLQDVTDKVNQENGQIELQFPSSAEGIEYRLFAYYQTRSTYLEQTSPLEVNTTVAQSIVNSYVQNGSRVVDHFSAKGAQLIVDFWEEHLLGGDSRELIKEVGNFACEDSMEIGAGAIAWWTPGLLDVFRSKTGYDLNKYLPLIFSYDTEHNGPLASPDRFFTDSDDLGQAFVNDYWVALESQFSAQVVYNLPMDMLANIPAVNAPECESLGSDHVIDAYRQFAGPANLAGKRIISSELGAQRNEVYSQTLAELIWDTKRSIAGSVNNFIYHGFPYTGSYPNTTDLAWFLDILLSILEYWIAQSGVPKIDLAFWLKKSEFFDVGSVYEANDLERSGYGYEYLSPDNFALPAAKVVDGVFAPERQSFKALIVRGNDTLTVPGVQYLVDYAHAGLPTIFSGGVPQNLSGYNVSGTEFVRSTLPGLVDLENLGILPRTRVNADRTWHTYWREDASSNVTELGEAASRGSVTFEATAVPYEYNAWTGEVTPILAYQQGAISTTIELQLAGNQTTVIGFHHNETASQGVRAIAFPEEVYSSALNDAGRLSVAAGNTSGTVLLSNGTTVALHTPAASIQLDQWSLIVESWSPPADLEADRTKASLSNSTFKLTEIAPWNAISDSLRNVSGRGFYSTTFTWPPSNGSADGAILELGAIMNTARAWVNGHQLPPLDPTDAKADIADCLVEGANVVEIVVSTTLGNALIPVHEQAKSSGTLWLGPAPVEQDYGLVSNVTIVPYLTTVIAL
ncbi:Putative Galactose-binding-like domain superfamily [Septoria linicola]|uniref:Galactose-binding-like domain superfamily n=1 Tax=Septoria linicola TaxID=215465 RepID=A0A9Q9AEV8_9PEZI|nr:putative Galactose-binding-like domain superfamily [Septoria linicola]USW47825.1 Putative Galactose-binding-like domain superfamily [Septoria linicola]